jgi:hypothetical protein
MVAAALALFFVTTRPSTGNIEAAETTPPATSVNDTELVDLATGASELMTGWDEVAVEGPGQIAGMIKRNSSFIAYGSTEETAQAWLSGDGASWRPFPQLDVPENAQSAIEHAVIWNNDLVALGNVDGGIGSWVAHNLTHWEYQGEIPDMVAPGIMGLAAGPELLAVQGPGNNLESLGWKSFDGITWTARPQFRLDSRRQRDGIPSRRGREMRRLGMPTGHLPLRRWDPVGAR